MYRHATLALYRACRALRCVLQHSNAGHTDITTLATAHQIPGKRCYHQGEGTQDSVGTAGPANILRQSRFNNALGYQQNTSSSWYVYFSLNVPKLCHTKSWGSVPDQPAHEC